MGPLAQGLRGDGMLASRFGEDRHIVERDEQIGLSKRSPAQHPLPLQPS